MKYMRIRFVIIQHRKMHVIAGVVRGFIAVLNTSPTSYSIMCVCNYVCVRACMHSCVYACALVRFHEFMVELVSISNVCVNEDSPCTPIKYLLVVLVVAKEKFQ